MYTGEGGELLMQDVASGQRGQCMVSIRGQCVEGSNALTAAGLTTSLTLAENDAAIQYACSAGLRLHGGSGLSMSTRARRNHMHSPVSPASQLHSKHRSLTRV